MLYFMISTWLHWRHILGFPALISMYGSQVRIGELASGDVQIRRLRGRSIKAAKLRFSYLKDHQYRLHFDPQSESLKENKLD